MNSISKRMIAGFAIATLANAFYSCSPVFVAQSRPHPRTVVYTTPAPAPAPEPVYASTLPPAPVQTVIVTPVVPVWAPPYVYVNEVHYYYFPDYMVYYDVFAQNYWYFDGYSWVHVVTLPAIQTYYGFNPYNSYIVIMNRNTYNPWLRHSHFEELYPRGYYKTAYAPRQSLGNNVALRAFDENQSRPVFVDKRSNKEVKVKYDVKNVSQKDVKNNGLAQQSEMSRPKNNTVLNHQTEIAHPKTESQAKNPRSVMNTDTKKNPVVIHSETQSVNTNAQPRPSKQNTQIKPKESHQGQIKNNTNGSIPREQAQTRPATPGRKPVAIQNESAPKSAGKPAPVMMNNHQIKSAPGNAMDDKRGGKRNK